VRPLFLFLMSLAGFLVVLSSSIGSHIQSVPISNQFGLLQMLPTLYWLGIGTMALALFLGMKAPNHIVFFAQATLLYLAVWGAPAFFETYASGWDVYMHYYSSESIVRIGHLSPEFAFSYENNYPGLFMMTSAFTLLAQPDPFSFLRFYSLFAAALTILSVYLFTRTYIPGLDHRLALVLAMMADVWVQITFSPQSVGLAVGLFVFVFLENRGIKWQALALVSFAFLVISHPTTTFLIMGALVAREIFVTIRKHWRPVSYATERRIKLLGAMMIVWAVWLLTAARAYLGFLMNDIESRIDYLLKVSDVVGGAVVQRTGGNLWLYAPYIRLATVGVFTLMALVALVLGLRKRFRDQKVPTTILMLFFVPFIFIALDIILLNSQLYDRGIMLLILSTSVILIFGFRYVRSIKPIRLAAIAIAVLMAASCFSTVYYQEGLNVVSQETVDASHFIADRLPPNAMVIGGRLILPVWSGGVKDYDWVQYYVFYNQTLGNLARQGMSVVAVFDHSSYLWSLQYGDSAQDFYKNHMSINLLGENTTQSANNNKVYDNGNYWVIYGWTNAPLI
jgi:hypothetical protein